MSGRTALIVADLQAGITQNFPFAGAALGPAAEAVRWARRNGILVIFVRAALRADGADLRDSNALFTRFFELGDLFHEGAPGTVLDAALGVDASDPVVTKRRTSAFAGTDLEILLRANGVRSIALCGTATGAVIAATAYAAADLDFTVTILADGCADPDPATHDFLVTTLFPSRLFHVLDVAEWGAALGAD